ncbi:MAG: sodium:solute symporter family protein [Candidatus Riflebacteria bacterium]|nr:sodium:solute symporter family protein [Candidatus Riflebacteria bacterium]
MNLDNSIVLVYVVVVLLIGFFCARRTKSFKDFAISDMNFGAFAIFATLSATFIGGGYSFGNAAKVFDSGIFYSVALLGFSLQVMLVGHFIAPKMFAHDGAVSVGDVLEPTYGKTARIIGGVLSFVSCAGILGAQLGAMGTLINTFFGFSIAWSIVIGCAIVLLYSTLGGISAVVWTDMLQFILLIVAVPAVFFLGLNQCGGWSELVAKLPAQHLKIIPEGGSILSFISLFLVFVFGETLVPPYVQRLLISKDNKTLGRATMLSGLLSVPFFLIAGSLGLLALVLLPDINSNAVFPSMINLLIPIGFKGFVIAGVVAIIMSSADSFLLCSSVAIVQDVYVPLTSEKWHDDKHKFRLARVVNLVTGLAAMAVCMFIPNVLDILVFAYNFWAPMILVQLIAALLKKPVSKVSFLGGFAGGLVGSVLWNMFGSKILPIDSIIVGVVCNFIVFTIMNMRSKANTSN